MLFVIIEGGQQLMPGVVKLLVFACLSRKWPERAAYAGAGSKVNGYSAESIIALALGSPRTSLGAGSSTAEKVSRAKRFSPLTMTGELRCSQDLVPHIFQHVQRALHSHFTGKNGIFILNAQNSLVANFHIGQHDFFPGTGTVSIAHRTEGLGGSGEVVLIEREIKDAISVDVILVESRVFHVRVENRTLLAQHADDFNRIALLPKEMAEIAVGPDLFADGLAQAQ